MVNNGRARPTDAWRTFTVCAVLIGLPALMLLGAMLFGPMAAGGGAPAEDYVPAASPQEHVSRAADVVLAAYRSAVCAGSASADGSGGGRGQGHCPDPLSSLLATFEVYVDSSRVGESALLRDYLRAAEQAGGLEMRLRDRKAGAYHWVRLSTLDKGTARVLPAIESRILESSIGYVRWRLCASGTAEHLVRQRSALQRLEGLIVDLRGNPGGHLIEAAVFADLWVPAQSVILELYRSIEGLREGRRLLALRARRDDDLNPDVPVVFITDGETASTAEAIVAIMKARGLGRSVGQTTKGDALAHVYINAPIEGKTSLRRVGGLIKVPMFDLYHNRGIRPDVPIADDPAAKPAGTDRPPGILANGASRTPFEAKCLDAAVRLINDRLRPRP